MPSKRVALLVPGILGSSLHYPREPVDHEVWGENLYTNYGALIAQPALLHWTGIRANARLIRQMHFSKRIPWPKVDLYDSLLKQLESDVEFKESSVLQCPYDWRDSILRSSEVIVSSISERLQLKLDTAPSSADPKLVFFCHSLGGLVIRAAIAKGLLHPDRIDVLIHIGTPLLGAPVAFRSAYSRTDLPWFDEVFSILRVIRTAAFKAMLLDSFRTFPSLYELMPHSDIQYLFYSPLLRGNPLTEDIIPKERRLSVRKAQEVVQISDLLLAEKRVPVFTIYTEASTRKKTDYEYSVKAVSRPATYEILAIHNSDFTGDGTVPSYSAMGSAMCKKVPLADVRHAYMCSSLHVIRSAMRLLDSSAKEAST